MPLTQVSPGLLDSNAQYTGFKNRLINGNTSVWQRGTSFSIVSPGVGTLAGAFTADRWNFENVNGNTMTVTQQANSSQLYGSGLYFIQAVVPTIVSGGNFIQMFQTIEAQNIADCAGGNVTLSFTAALTSTGGTPQIWIFAGYPSAMDNWTTATYPQVGTLTPSSTPTRYTLTIPLSSVYRNGLRIYIGIRNPGGSSVTSATFSIGEIQLEKGSTATSFDYRPYTTELQLCQRYLQYVIDARQNIAAAILASSYTASQSLGVHRFIVPMRAAPSMAFSSASHFALVGNNTSITVLTVSLSSSGLESARIDFTGTGMLQGGAAIVQANTGTTAPFISLSAEL
jgi:hypothetical protein